MPGEDLCSWSCLDCLYMRTFDASFNRSAHTFPRHHFHSMSALPPEICRVHDPLPPLLVIGVLPFQYLTANSTAYVSPALA
jgi:hypothetical protein